MKMLKKDFDALQAQVNAVCATPKHADYLDGCIEKDIPFIAYAWNVFHARANQKMEQYTSKDYTIKSLLLNNQLYSYCDDSNIETALRKILNEKDYTRRQNERFNRV